MAKITESRIKEIARNIAQGHTCYIQRYNANISLINHAAEDEKELAMQEKAIAEIERKPGDYIKIGQLSIDDQLVIMKDFLKELSDKSVQKELSSALIRKNPVRNFKQVIESDMVLKIHWGNFNFEQYQKWVSKCIIDAYNY